MDNLLESNERTLVIFDSVCTGLAECLALVHADIKHMTEHRNQLASLEQEKLQAKLFDPVNELNNGQHDRQQKKKKEKGTGIVQTNLDVTDSSTKTGPHHDDDPHHLASLKLLDKRLADSFSQALSMCDKQKTSLNARKQYYQSTASANSQHRPSIFQVLLGKGNSYKHNNNNNNNSGDSTNKRQPSGAKSGKEGSGGEPDRTVEPDNRVIIDDINRQTRLAMQYSKQLEAHLFKVEDLRARYEMHLKMGLVVKSVSRAYSSSTTTSNTTTSSSNHNSPNSLGRRQQHYTSSLMVNDSSSLGTTRSSLSSLNLSSWSFTRRNRSDRSRQNSSTSGGAGGGCNVDGGRNCCQLVADDSSLNRNQQKYVSTISLDSMSRRNKRYNLANLISLSSAKQQQQPNFIDYPNNMQDSCQHSSQVSSNNNCLCNIAHQQHLIETELPPAYIGAPSSRPLSQYTYGVTGEFITPTATGTMSGGDARYINDSTGGGGSLQKLPSHSSIKGKGKMKNSGYHQQEQHAEIGQGKTTIKEFIENIERIESEFESYMGSFLLNIEDIQGFARICQGDVFEINIKYGNAQKFKTKISVLKENRQKCDNRQTVFKSRIADVIAIKAYECKGLGKRVLLGHKLCETRDLFTARSQLMTVSLNQTGSIKLNLIITWNPLHMTPNSSLALPPGLDIAHISLPPTPVSSSTLSSVSSAQSLMNGNSANNSTTMINIQSSNISGYHRIKHASPKQQVGPNVVQIGTVGGGVAMDENAYEYGQQNHLNRHHHQRQPAREQATKFQNVDTTTYGYYEPEPDYLTSDFRH